MIGAFEDERMLGCCMLIKQGNNTVRLRQMAVMNNVQGKGIGRALMNFAENLARDMGYKKLLMHARATAAGFYEKQGYHITGEQFTRSYHCTLYYGERIFRKVLSSWFEVPLLRQRYSCQKNYELRGLRLICGILLSD